MRLPGADTRVRRWWVVLSAGIVILGAIWAIAFAMRPRAPFALAQSAWKSVQDAELSALDDARDVVQSAHAHYDQAWLLINAELERFFLLRDFGAADSLLLAAIDLAGESKRYAQNVREQRHERLRERLAELRQMFDEHNGELRQNLHSITLRQITTTAELKLGVADRQLAASQNAEAAVADAERAVVALCDALEVSSSEDEQTAATSKKWLNETLNWSALTDSAALIIVKTRHRGYLVRRGKVVESFPVELGLRSGRQKLVAGDGATPEGMYRVTAKRNKGAKYYKALDLDYPNTIDRQRFANARKSGRIPPKARIGGNIQVHGEGGRGNDWTAGCVAVTNARIDSLMEHMEVGGRVTIVRHLNGWNQ